MKKGTRKQNNENSRGKMCLVYRTCIRYYYLSS